MEGGKKTAVAIALVLLIVAAIVFSIKRRSSAPDVPPEILNTVHKKIDEKTLDIESLTAGEWMKRGDKGGRYKNAKTGKYTMVNIAICSECKNEIPALTVDRSKFPADAPDSVIFAEASNDWVCPRCGERPRLGYVPTAGEE